VLTFSDLQADIVAGLIRAGVEVHAFNQRSIAGILDMIRKVGCFVGAGQRAEALVMQLAKRLEDVRGEADGAVARPKVYFEEWDDPMISGIHWVSELIAIAGGADIFPELATGKSATGRIVTIDQIIAAAPDIIIGSWCGKKFSPSRVAARTEFDVIPAVRTGRVHEIKSPIILQPGPAALTDGLDALVGIIRPEY
jgi:iron complex transport system substrate-binding protein